VSSELFSWYAGVPYRKVKTWILQAVPVFFRFFFPYLSFIFSISFSLMIIRNFPTPSMAVECVNNFPGSEGRERN